MADRQWFSNGMQVYETGEEEYFVYGVQICEDQAEAPPVGAIMNQLQGSHLGADLYNGTLT